MLGPSVDVKHQEPSFVGLAMPVTRREATAKGIIVTDVTSKGAPRRSGRARTEPHFSAAGFSSLSLLTSPPRASKSEVSDGPRVKKPSLPELLPGAGEPRSSMHQDLLENIDIADHSTVSPTYENVYAALESIDFPVRPRLVSCLLPWLLQR